MSLPFRMVKYLPRRKYTLSNITVHYHLNQVKFRYLSNQSYVNSNILCSNGYFNICSRQRKLMITDVSVILHRHISFKESFESAVVTHSAVFKSISESTVVQYTQNFIIQFHDTSGLPWWLSVIFVTCTVRAFITLPLALYQSYVVARLENCRKEMDDIVNSLRYDLDREIRKNRWTEKKAKAHFNSTVRNEWTRLIERDNCHPAKAAILSLVQIPLWVVFSTAFRNLVYMLPHQDTAAQLKKLELSVGGTLWFPDLTVSDILVIPLALGLVNLAIIEVQAMMFKGQKSKIQKYATNFFRGFAIFMIPVATTVPSCVTLYWLTSSVFGLCQNLTVLSPRVRKFFGIPPTPSLNLNPYTHLAQQIKNKFKT